MKKRDLIQEIKSIKSRAEFNDRYDFSSRLNDIEYALEEFISFNGDYNNELLKYIPISTIACYEAFFRSATKEIVDFGKPYSDNVADFNQSKNVKLDFEVVSAIQTKILTVGEFVAHIIPFNNFDDINSNLKILLGKDFLNELKSYKKKVSFENKDYSDQEFKEKINEIIASVIRTYELRHIFCHEFATNIKIDKDEILRNFKNCKFFLIHANNVIWDLLYPNAPMTQSEMNIEAQSRLEQKEKELDTLVQFIRNINKEEDFRYFDDELFLVSYEQWKQYRKSVAEYKSSFSGGGTIHPLLYSSASTIVTVEKILSLKDEFEILLRKKNYS